VKPANLQTQWARLLLGSLAAAGVRDVVLSPGGRSTPFAWAALHEPALRTHRIVDERSAGFFAIGHARVTGRPTLLICTSGSAAANYFPAIVEASEAAIPLLVLTADRGLELQHAAAPQTIDQTKLYGGYVRSHFELGSPDPHPRMLAAVQRMAAQSVLLARGRHPGPVHLNARARKPLEPRAADDGEGADLEARVDAVLERGTAQAFAGAVVPSTDALRSLAEACRGARRGLLVCGPSHPWDAPTPADVAALARASGFPVAAEPGSQLRFVADVDPAYWVDHFAALAGVPAFRSEHQPDLILQLGRPPTASEWGASLDRWTRTERWVIAPHGWPDPWSSAAAVVEAPVGPAIRALTGELTAAPAPDDDAAGDREAWLDRLHRASRVAAGVIQASLRDGFPEGAAVRAAIDAVPDDGLLVLGNSLPIREAELFVGAGERRLTVLTQRGANGIDGLVSGAAGAAMAAGRPTVLILGDVSFAHDLGGLATARGVRAPLLVVVLNNGGGRIFERLPIADGLAGHDHFDAWLTPPLLDLEAAARAFGAGFVRATDAPSLGDALERALAGAGATVVEVVVPEGGTTAHQRALARRLEAELAP
jgi:2-succinyl-5-enolpyruvyl-6-hydroxy-3-cyclohexene-1-carboxylate synthase